ncbi:DUF2937 family protein [Aquipseudomonas ullengensis]|uniref:DUF2937 family protein n=1 Tax=Aquipseudomonas ullengensis TaxID=2759166 RepID=A0A7W4LL25_9GAMM|nr:DUF2937 family protein [Pseudomonas ullengensis]MBB2495117.1 DUF2937 family protein [Pseudomonas ullengensis]
MFRSYLRLAMFALGLLIGVQVPGFIDDYSKRVTAHRDESEQSLLGFRQTARQFFAGDLNALVAHYRASTDDVMRSDADSIAHLVERNSLMEAEWLAMQGPWYAQVWHLASDADQALLQETYDAYSYQILLAPQAIAWGIGCALLLAWLVELVFVGLGWTLGYGRKHKTIAYEKRHWR